MRSREERSWFLFAYRDVEWALDVRDFAPAAATVRGIPLDLVRWSALTAGVFDMNNFDYFKSISGFGEPGFPFRLPVFSAAEYTDAAVLLLAGRDPEALSALASLRRTGVVE